MKLRVLSFALLAGALVLHFGYSAPCRQEAAQAQEGFARARSERLRLEGMLTRLEHEAEVTVRVGQMDLPRGSGPAEATAFLRRSVLRALEGVSVSGVRLGVTPGRAPIAAKLSLKAGGTFAEVVRLSGRLVRPGAGVILEHVDLSPERDGMVGLTAEGVSLAASP
jgi:hypothetical protein